jgi:hypothetical protein
MSLSETSISAIASALLHERDRLSAELAFWSECPRRADRARYCGQIDLSLAENAAALVELANGMAPWLKQHPEYVSTIQPKETT